MDIIWVSNKFLVKMPKKGIKTKNVSPKKTRSGSTNKIKVTTNEVEKETFQSVGPLTAESSPKIIVAKENPPLSDTSIVCLRHPKSDCGALFQFTSDSQSISELINFDDHYRSWFIGDFVTKDGALYLSATIDPAFLALPYLIKNAKTHFVPMDQIFDDAQYPFISRLSLSDRLLNMMDKMADVKDVSCLRVYRYNERKAIDWLVTKFEKLLNIFKEKGQLHSSIIKDDDLFRRYVWGIMSDYISCQLSRQLAVKLDIKEEAVLTKSDSNKRKRADELSEPTENYCTEEKKSVKKIKEMSQSQKKLQKASVGTKNLSSFFTKKA